MVSVGRGRIFRRKDGKYLVYLPKDLAEDSMFPFKGSDTVFVKVSFGRKMARQLITLFFRNQNKDLENTLLKGVMLFCPL
jgi:hypothetical protein